MSDNWLKILQESYLGIHRKGSTPKLFSPIDFRSRQEIKEQQELEKAQKKAAMRELSIKIKQSNLKNIKETIALYIVVGREYGKPVSRKLISDVQEFAELFKDKFINKQPIRALMDASPAINFISLSLPKVFCDVIKDFTSDCKRFAQATEDKEKSRVAKEIMTKYPSNFTKSLNFLYDHYHHNVSPFSRTGVFGNFPKSVFENLMDLQFKLLTEIAVLNMKDSNGYSQNLRLVNEIIDFNRESPQGYFLKGVLERTQGYGQNYGNENINGNFKKAIDLDESYAKAYIRFFIKNAQWSQDDVYKYIQERFSEERISQWRSEINQEGVEEKHRKELEEMIEMLNGEANKISSKEKIDELEGLIEKLETKSNKKPEDIEKLTGLYRELKGVLQDLQAEAVAKEQYEKARALKSKIEEVDQKLNPLEAQS